MCSSLSVIINLNNLAMDKVKIILELMEIMDVTINDLHDFKDGKITDKFPFELYFSNRTKSSDVKYAEENTSCTPIGVIINNTVYALPVYVDLLTTCGKAEEYCKTVWRKYCLSGDLPTLEQLKSLKKNLVVYNKISDFLKKGKLGEDLRTRFAVSHSHQLSCRQHCYNLESGTESIEYKCVSTLPVINL